ncbi:MAG: TIGR04084 family radical SAM/SPASM domain-containing protein [Methanoregula sp.]|nr:MAG: TIGR04084 family radical SAM/SPASM domain-containing protein [Methanoregula sp.]
MYYHLILTDDCNLCCSYCRARAFDESIAGAGNAVDIDEGLPADLDYDLDTLYRFLENDPSPTVTFYGGEPLLKRELVETIMDNAPVRRFMIQTNGTLLDRLSPEYVNRFSTILVSLDGREELTDAHRGAGTYRKVMGNVRRIRAAGFSGELIARMTVTQDTDIADAVTCLWDNPDHSFSSIHWQLDAGFADDFSSRKFASWVNERYNPGIRDLVRRWVDLMAEHHRVPRWYPFVDPIDDLLNGRASPLRCGSGHANYSIMTDGHIAPCPIMVGMRQYYLGHISTTSPAGLRKIDVGGDCAGCRIRDFCGGRCLYAHIMHPWTGEGKKLVCGTVENLHDALTGALPEVRAMVAGGVLSPADFSHEKYNGCEIIP